MSWCPSYSNSLWQGWSWGLVYCPGGNGTDPIWRVLASSLGIFCWTPLKIVTLTLTLWPINSSVLTSLLLPHLSSTLTDSLLSMNLICLSKTAARFMQDCRKEVRSIPYVSVGFFSKFKTEFYCISFFLTSRLHFWIHQLWQSGFSRVYSNCCYSCSFTPEIIKKGQSFHKMYSNNILNFQESTTILNACTKTSGNVYIYTHINAQNHAIIALHLLSAALMAGWLLYS